jgi:hypothetical protein
MSRLGSAGMAEDRKSTSPDEFKSHRLRCCTSNSFIVLLFILSVRHTPPFPRNKPS